MKLSTKYLSALVASLLLLAGAGWLADRRALPDRPGTRMAAAEPATASDPRIQALSNSPQARAWEERQAFESRARAFLRDASALGAVQRSEQARALSASIDIMKRKAAFPRVSHCCCASA